MKTDVNTIANVSDIANEMVAALGVEVVSIERFAEVTGAHAALLKGSAGVYCSHNDFIAVSRTSTFNNRDFTVFHELAHSTGSVKRLARDTMVRASQGVYPTKKEYATEEMIAQRAAAKLCVGFELIPQSVADDLVNNYAFMYPDEETEISLMEVDKVVNYMLTKLKEYRNGTEGRVAK